ncbi:MAG: HAMP domain-containing histidine kinase [Proteobacteria bacterium]|nr:HAMP domain-containing histidine kinase [Pseudomonadota bacterium]
MEKKKFSKLYVKMTAWFLCTILATLFAVTLLFYMTVGRSLSQKIHSMLRSHSHYVSILIADLMEKNTSEDGINHFINQFSESYGFGIAVIDQNKKIYFHSRRLTEKDIPVSADMVDAIGKNGIFVQSGHFGRPIIYMLPISSATGDPIYVYITKTFPESMAEKSFLAGLVLVGVLLSLATYPFSKGITRPISELASSLQKMATGHFDQSPVCTRKDEIGDLFRVYRDMSQSVNRMILSKKQLLADMSHELCSPLSRIRVGTELLKEINTDERAMRHLKNIEKDIHSMDLLIGNLAIFSRMNLPNFTLNTEIINPKILLDHIYQQYLPIVTKKNRRLEVIQNEKMPDIRFDFERLKQVFSNLLDNAIRYSQEKQSIRIGAYEDGRYVCFFVEDQGPGVPENESERIFEPLYRVDSSRNQASGGAGLGLAISKKIMDHHKGNLFYKRENENTFFSFCIDIKPM